MWKEKKELCDSTNSPSGDKCIRDSDHNGNCWGKWNPEPGYPGSVVRKTWVLGSGFMQPGWTQRRVWNGNR